MNTEIILTAPWTHPYTGESYPAGSRLFVEGGLVRNDGMSGLEGRYAFPGTPDAERALAKAAAKKAPSAGAPSPGAATAPTE